MNNVTKLISADWQDLLAAADRIADTDLAALNADVLREDEQEEVLREIGAALARLEELRQALRETRAPA